MNFLQTILFLAIATARAQVTTPVPPCTDAIVPIPWCITQYPNDQGGIDGYKLEAKDPDKTCQQEGFWSTICCTADWQPGLSSLEKLQYGLDNSCSAALDSGGGGEQPGNGEGGQNPDWSGGGGQQPGNGGGGQNPYWSGGGGQQPGNGGGRTEPILERERRTTARERGRRRTEPILERERRTTARERGRRRTEPILGRGRTREQMNVSQIIGGIVEETPLQTPCGVTACIGRRIRYSMSLGFLLT
ncbi:hypothetical protein PCASD_24205 [Puccinia coronata f. sp. avenae]|uniref:CBM1 domain-containing protein n=1 Tax=Puccinia coronata f. sp. avenae TaxID=200324 RepID=A0A2N5TPM0_9BASI|nr:hypothetical protein PCASD_24205 [Puccinia coronata f. sp. avenae]